MNIDLILLAAGNSRRFGSNKLLYQLNGKPMYAYMLEKLLHAAKEEKGCRVVVVSQYEELLWDAKRRAEELLGEVCLVKSRESVKGMSYSIKKGIWAAKKRGEHLQGELAAAFFSGDMPYLKEESIRGFLKGFQESGMSVGCMKSREKCGNPAVFLERCFKELEGLSGDEGGKKVLRRYWEECYFYEVGEEEWVDVDYIIVE